VSADDPVETETPVFTEEEVYMIVGYLAGWLGVEDGDESGVAVLTDQAIQEVLSRG
jgi:hypothetical protein